MDYGAEELSVFHDAGAVGSDVDAVNGLERAVRVQRRVSMETPRL